MTPSIELYLWCTFHPVCHKTSNDIITIVTDCITFDPPFHCDKMALQVLHFFKIWIFFVANI